MRALKLKSFGKSRLAKLSLLPVIIFAIIYGTLLQQNKNKSNAATALCYGQPGTHTVVAPSSVTPGQSFKLTGITGAGNTTVATVNSTTITLDVSGASPATITENWNGGPVYGDYSAAYPDATLTATGAIGSHITVSLSSITVSATVGGSPITITCSTSNGQLTATGPGQSLILATINIIAPASSSTPTTNSSKSSTVSTKTSPTSTTNATQPATNVTTTQQSSSLADSGPNTQKVNIIVTDYKGQAVKGATVYLDSMPSKNTDSKGNATFSNILIGKHTVTIKANGQRVTKTIQAKDVGQVLGVHVQMPPPSHLIRNLAIGGAVIALLLVAGAGWFIKKRFIKTKVGAEPVLPVAPPSTPQLSPAETAQIIQPSIPQPSPPANQPATKPTDTINTSP